MGTGLFAGLLLLLLLCSCRGQIKEPGVRYSLNLEPRIDECANNVQLSDIFEVQEQRFRKLSRYTLAVVARMELKQAVHAPIQLSVLVERLQVGGGYAFFMAVPHADICQDIKKENSVFSSISKQLDLRSCPFHPRKFNLNNFTVGLENIELGREHLGKYRSTAVLSGQVAGQQRDFYCRVYYTRVERERTNQKDGPLV